MDSARLKNNLNEVIYEDKLPLMYDQGILNEDEFICVGCSAKSIPCSYKPENLRRPYFRVDNHMADCGVFKYDELAKIAKKKQISTSSGFPFPYPSKLYLQDKSIKIVDEESPNTNAPEKEITSYTQNSNKTNITTDHHRTSSTIRPIVKHFINFPCDRNIPLSLPMLNLELNTYAKIFKKINKYNIDNEEFKSSYLPLKLYYVPLSVVKDNIQVADETISLKLLLGKNETFNLTIDVSTWSRRKKSEILNELKDLTDEKRKLYGKNQKSKENIYLFFVGSLDENDPYIFKLYKNDFRLYFAELCTILY